MVDLSCHLKHVESVTWEIASRVSVGGCLIKLTEMERPAHSGRHHFLCSEHEQSKGESELRTSIHWFLFPECEQQ